MDGGRIQDMPRQQLKEALGALSAAGATAASMTGSGSAVFGLFPDEESARAAFAALERNERALGWRAYVVSVLEPGSFPF